LYLVPSARKNTVEFPNDPGASISVPGTIFKFVQVLGVGECVSFFENEIEVLRFWDSTQKYLARDACKKLIQHAHL